ncbi:MAG: GTP 3',8-cyclase MoaA [Methanoculleaceae archaeon]
MSGVLEDPYGRRVTNLRISLTSSCNLNCIYCHSEGETDPGEEMSTEEIIRLIRVASGFGIRSVKFTGGEPLIRRDLEDIIQGIPPGVESSMTTNGTLLADRAESLSEAGLCRVNISLDSLRPERYRYITGSDALSDVLEGIESAVEAGLTPVKINTVILRGINEDEIGELIEFVRGRRELILQLIELMEFNDCQLHANIDEIERELEEKANRIIVRRMHHRRKFCLDGAEIEVVRPLHNTEFCAYCNRLRVTSDGQLKPCLLRNDNHVDIRGADDESLRELFREAVRRRAPFFR